jgi:hypothetical protein
MAIRIGNKAEGPDFFDRVTDLAMLEEEAEREGWRAEKPVYEHLCRRNHG